MLNCGSFITQIVVFVHIKFTLIKSVRLSIIFVIIILSLNCDYQVLWRRGMEYLVSQSLCSTILTDDSIDIYKSISNDVSSIYVRHSMQYNAVCRRTLIVL